MEAFDMAGIITTLGTAGVFVAAWFLERNERVAAIKSTDERYALLIKNARDDYNLLLARLIDCSDRATSQELADRER